MKDMKRRALSFITAVVFLLGGMVFPDVDLLPGFSVAVSAAATGEITVNSWGALQTALNNASKDENHPTKIKLTGDCVADSGDTFLEVKEDTFVEIDLNGKTINRYLTSAVKDGYVILNKGTLTVKDSGTGGKITGGRNTGYGGGIYNDGTLTIESGSITTIHNLRNHKLCFLL